MRPLSALQVAEATLARRGAASPGSWSLRHWLGAFGLARAALVPDAERFATPVAVVRQVIEDLAGLNLSTERDFLSIGGKLAELQNAARHISTEMTEVTELMCGNQSDHAAKSLLDALAQSHGMQMYAEDANQSLTRIHEAACLLGKTFSSLDRSQANFHALATLTRVETARLGAAGSDFGNLADEVNSLAGSIQAGVDRALETAGQLSTSVEATLHNAIEAGGRNVRTLPAIIADIGRTLDSIREGQERARQASERLKGQYGEVLRSVGDLVLSIQFQDIARQQVEHVIEALTALCSDSRTNSRLPSRAGAVLSLQSAQLADAGRKFGRSVADIHGSLELIAARVGQMTEESRILSGDLADRQESHFVEIERGCTLVLDAIRVCARTEIHLQEVAGALSAAIADAHAIVSGLQEIDARMQRLSLNAIIRAAHIGDLGNTLSVLASEMQNLALDSGRRSATAIEMLSSMQTGAAQLSLPKGTADSNPLLDELRGAVEELHSSSERGFARINKVQVLGTVLHREIAAARESFTVGDLFAGVISRVCRALAEVAGQAHDASGLDTSDAGDLGARYTMKAERDVHGAAVVQGLPPLEPDAAEADESEEAGSVELF